MYFPPLSGLMVFLVVVQNTFTKAYQNNFSIKCWTIYYSKGKGLLVLPSYDAGGGSLAFPVLSPHYFVMLWIHFFLVRQKVPPWRVLSTDKWYTCLNWLEQVMKHVSEDLCQLQCVNPSESKYEIMSGYIKIHCACLSVWGRGDLLRKHVAIFAVKMLIFV